MVDWQVLVVTQPTENASVRMRVWREIKALGAAMLRDGVYLLPRREWLQVRLEALARHVIDGEGRAYVLAVEASEQQDAQWRLLFDRAAEYGALLARCQNALGAIGTASPDELKTAMRSLESDFAALAEIDYFPGAAKAQLDAAIAALRAAAVRRLTPGEPRAMAAGRGRLRRLERSEFRRKTWATRRNLWIDRVASAWLIRRFIDPDARFVWIADPAAKPKRAIGFDFDGADFTHVDGRVTFEVLAARFGLGDDPALVRIGSIVHALDVGGAVVPEAAGLEAVFGGLRRAQSDDDAFLQAANAVLDGLYANFSNAAGAPAASEQTT
jgi:hypothetical protein